MTYKSILSRLNAVDDKTCLDPCHVTRLSALCKKRKQRGAPCNDNAGYCDAYQRCRPVDEEGPLDRLQAVLFRSGKILGWIKVTSTPSLSLVACASSNTP